MPTSVRDAEDQCNSFISFIIRSQHPPIRAGIAIWPGGYAPTLPQPVGRGKRYGITRCSVTPVITFGNDLTGFGTPGVSRIVGNNDADKHHVYQPVELFV